MDRSWQAQLKGEFTKPYFKELTSNLQEERSTSKVYPPAGEVFAAFEATPFDAVRAVMLGQDPYHGEGQAHGMSFSVRPGIAVPPSLLNIYKELSTDLGIEPPNHGYLRAWAQQGVLLLNSSLTVQAKSPNSHKWLGWEIFTDRVIQVLSDREVPLVFLLWGASAKSKAGLVRTDRHKVLTAAHPSPRSAESGFFGSRPFSQTNAFLASKGLPPIDWQLPSDPMTETAPAPALEAPTSTGEAEADLNRLLTSMFD